MKNRTMLERAGLSKDVPCVPCGSYEHCVLMPIGSRVRSIDICVSDIVAALNCATSTKTIASCCGHGKRFGSVLLEDGRQLLVCNQKEYEKVCKVFHRDEQLAEGMQEFVGLDDLNKAIEAHRKECGGDLVLIPGLKFQCRRCDTFFDLNKLVDVTDEFEKLKASIQTCEHGHKYYAKSHEYPCPLCLLKKLENNPGVKVSVNIANLQEQVKEHNKTCRGVLQLAKNSSSYFCSTCKKEIVLDFGKSII